MKSPAILALLISFPSVGLSATLDAQNRTCDQFRAMVPDLAALMKMTKAERDDLKRFVISNENDLKACLGARLERLKTFLK